MNYDPRLAIMHLIRLIVAGDNESARMLCRMYVRRVLRSPVVDARERQMAMDLKELMHTTGFVSPKDVLRGDGP